MTRTGGANSVKVRGHGLIREVTGVVDDPHRRGQLGQGEESHSRVKAWRRGGTSVTKQACDHSLSGIGVYAEIISFNKVM